jgi:hypothetical protein
MITSIDADKNGKHLSLSRIGFKALTYRTQNINIPKVKAKVKQSL